VGGDDGDAVGALDGSVERQRREAVLGQKRSVDRRSTRIRFSSSGDDGAKERRPASTCATGTRSFAAASAPTSVELVSPKTTTAYRLLFQKRGLDRREQVAGLLAVRARARLQLVGRGGRSNSGPWSGAG
jgi:hypothetical protein